MNENETFFRQLPTTTFKLSYRTPENTDKGLIPILAKWGSHGWTKIASNWGPMGGPGTRPIQKWQVMGGLQYPTSDGVKKIIEIHKKA